MVSGEVSCQVSYAQWQARVLTALAFAAEMPEAAAAAADEARQEGADEDTGDEVPPTKVPRSRWLDEEPDEEPEAPLNKVLCVFETPACSHASSHALSICDPLSCSSLKQGGQAGGHVIEMRRHYHADAWRPICFIAR